MTNSSSFTIDGELVRALAALLEETGPRESECAVAPPRTGVPRNAPATPAVTLAMSPGNAPAAPAAATAVPAGAVKSPMVGTAYLGPQPGDPPFVVSGQTVSEGQVLLIIEAMKVMNQIRAPR